VERQTAVSVVLITVGVVIIVLAAFFAFSEFVTLSSSSKTTSDLNASVSWLVYALSQVLFLAVAVWGGSVLLAKGLEVLR
jgi:uncharacterized membrane protein